MIDNDQKALERGCYFDETAANRAVKFLETYTFIPELGAKSAEALRIVDVEQRWKQEGCSSFSEWVAKTLGYSPGWATQRLTWLKVVETLEASGVIGGVSLSVDAAYTLWGLGDEPEAIVRAFLETENKPTEKNIKAAVEKQKAYITQKKIFNTLTYEEFESLFALGEARISLPEGTTPTVESLVEAAKTGIPNNKDILAVARGDKLKELDTNLKVTYEAHKEEAAKQKEIADLEQRLNILKLPRLLKPTGTTDDDQDEDEEDEEVKTYSVGVNGDFLAMKVKEEMTATDIAQALTDFATDIMNGKLKISKHSEIIIDPEA